MCAQQRKARSEQGNFRRLGIESLESRRLLAADLTVALDTSGRLRIGGTERPDRIMVYESAGQVHIEGVSQGFPSSGVQSVLVYGKGGNDSIYLNNLTRAIPTYVNAGAGNDIVYGGPGNDSIRGGLGDDRIYGLAGNDFASGDDGNDFIRGGTGNDRLEGNAGVDTLAGEDDNDSCQGGSGNDVVRGGTGKDNLSGGLGNDYLAGEDGNDSISGDDGNDRELGGSGDDSIRGGPDSTRFQAMMARTRLMAMTAMTACGVDRGTTV